VSKIRKSENLNSRVIRLYRLV